MFWLLQVICAVVAIALVVSGSVALWIGVHETVRAMRRRRRRRSTIMLVYRGRAGTDWRAERRVQRW